MEDDWDMTYKGGFTRLIPHQGGKQAGHYEGMQALLSELADRGLDALQSAITQAPKQAPKAAVTAAQKLDQLSAELAGQPMLVTVHALVIAASRRQDPPALAQRLFLDMWRVKSAVLLQNLDTRWALSALITFRIFGENEVQRLTAAELDVLFSMTKLYESERLFSGVSPDQLFRRSRAIKVAMPLGLEPYSLSRGDLDRNLLGRLWLNAEQDPVLRPLACRLLNEVNREKGSVFRRLNVMKRLRREKRKQRERDAGA